MPGLDREVIREINWERAIQNILLDTRSDFVLSPHFDLIYNRASERLIERTTQGLRSGDYQPRLPITLSVPKSNFLTRPGSILEPQDRLVHQALLEQALPRIEENMDRTRSFSHVPNGANALFQPSHEGWDAFQACVRGISNAHPFVLRADVANYFETIPQHAVINLLNAAGVRGEIVNLLEEQLLAFQQRQSTGIIQGIYPSDVLGNFYLSDFDADCEMHGLTSARYVDDIYVGFNDERSARRELVRLNARLRSSGLFFNTSKTSILTAANVRAEEGALEELFDEARGEIYAHLEWLSQSGYGFQGNWIINGDIPTEEEIELQATKRLLFYDGSHDSQREKIERFCLPILRGGNDDSAIDLVFDNFDTRPQLTRIYASYLTHFSRESPDIAARISRLMQEDQFFCDYQRMYVLASILNRETNDASTVMKCQQWMESGIIGAETRALAAIFVAKFGSPQQKRSVRLRYENEPSEYVRAAILYSAQFFTLADRRTAKRAWGGHSSINALIADAI
jgi:Reverse transcriptase (RNA-dependent DNA polymerase)